MARMRATQIYLPEDLAAALDRAARARGTSRASLIRAAARGFVERQSPSEDDLAAPFATARVLSV